MKQNASLLRTEVRRPILAGVARGLARDNKRENAFKDSQMWQGYQNAYVSWERAIWSWIDAGVTCETEERWRAVLLGKKESFSPASDYSVAASVKDMEHYLQTYLVRRAYFLGGLRHRKEGDPAWFKDFSFYVHVAGLLNDNEVFSELARLTRRKPSRDQGRRSLRLWLLWLWVPGCMWALTNDGMAALLVWSDDASSDGQTKVYSEGSIKNMISDLNLWRPVKPLFWGFDSRGQLVSM